MKRIYKNPQLFRAYMAGRQAGFRDAQMWRARSGDPQLRATLVRNARAANQQLVHFLKLIR
jgi:hypothetical protein